MKPHVAFLPAGRDACALYRLFLPHLHYPESVFLYNKDRLLVEKFAHCQVAIVQRQATQANLDALIHIKKMGMKLIYDLDDDLWSVPTYNPIHKAIKQFIAGFEYCASICDAVTVSTQHLRVMVRKSLGKRCPPVEVIENALDYDWFRPLDSSYRRNSDKVTLGWAGTDTHSGDIKAVMELLPTLLNENPNLRFEMVGHKLPDHLAAFGDRCKQRDFVPIAEFSTYWSSWQWDIALAPLEKNKFNLSKSNIKMLEAAAVKIPCVATDIGEYSKFCSHSRLLRERVLSNTRKDWLTKLTALIRDTELRRAVGDEMHNVAFEHYNVVKRVPLWEHLAERLVGD